MNTSLSDHIEAASYPLPMHQVTIFSFDYANLYKLRDEPANKGSYQVSGIRLHFPEL